ncbi:MAG TPA: YcxB family protein [Gemmatimonadaceae bacterium]|nr:YcxB family protein [Gemmatimonadaceae bacterium]
MQGTLRFQIDPKPDETARACSAMAQLAMPPSRGGLLMLALYAAVGVLAYFLTPSSRLATFAIGVAAVLATAYSLQAEGRRRLRRLRVADPHANESHFVELGPEGVHTWCAHIDMRYPWSDFSMATEDREFYLFIRPSGTGSAVPKRLLDNAADEVLRTRIREWSPELGAALVGNPS